MKDSSRNHIELWHTNSANMKDKMSIAQIIHLPQIKIAPSSTKAQPKSLFSLKKYRPKAKSKLSTNVPNNYKAAKQQLNRSITQMEATIEKDGCFFHSKHKQLSNSCDITHCQDVYDENKVEAIQPAMNDMFDSIRINEAGNKSNAEVNIIDYTGEPNKNGYLPLRKYFYPKSKNMEYAIKVQQSHSIRVKKIDEMTDLMKKELSNDQAVCAQIINKKKGVVEKVLNYTSELSEVKSQLLRSIKECDHKKAIYLIERHPEIIVEHYAVYL